MCCSAVFRSVSPLRGLYSNTSAMLQTKEDTNPRHRFHWCHAVIAEDRDRTLVEFGKRISHNWVRMVVKKRRFHWVNQEHGRDSTAIEDMVENEAMKTSFERPF